MHWYREQGASLCLRLNLEVDDDEAQWSKIAFMAVILGAQIGIAALGVKSEDKAYGAKVVRCCEAFLERGLDVHVSRPLPRCVLTPNQFALLEQRCGMQHSCEQETAIPVLNPDGKTVFPCNSLPVSLPLPYIFEQRSSFLCWSQVRRDACKRLPQGCLNCAWLRDGICQPGCMGIF